MYFYLEVNVQKVCTICFSIRHTMDQYILGISCFYHDSAASLISNEGEILAAAQEERFSRIKHDSNFPFNALDYCLKISKELGIVVEEYVYYEKPIRIFMRLLETYFSTAPRGFSSFYPAMQSWISESEKTRASTRRRPWAGTT